MLCQQMPFYFLLGSMLYIFPEVGQGLLTAYFGLILLRWVLR